MIEYFRFLLSAVVAEAHIWPLGVPWLAWQSVFAFYTLSGFLIVRVLNERYGFSLIGFATFGLNRILRLWPAYLIFLLVAFLLLSTSLVSPYGILRLPANWSEFLVNVTVLGEVGFDYRFMAQMPFLVPNSWSLSVEMFCYFLLAIFFAKTALRLLALFTIGLLGIVFTTITCWDDWVGYGPYCFQNRYGVLHAGFIPFAIGGLTYFYRKHLSAFAALRPRTIIAILVGLFALIASIDSLHFTIAPFFGSLLIVPILGLSERYSFKIPMADFFGRASYHLFISHWTIGAILIYYLNVENGTSTLYLLTVSLSIMTSCVLVPLEHRVERMRKRVRSRRNVVLDLPIDQGRPSTLSRMPATLDHPS